MLGSKDGGDGRQHTPDLENLPDFWEARRLATTIPLDGLQDAVRGGEACE